MGTVTDMVMDMATVTAMAVMDTMVIMAAGEEIMKNQRNNQEIPVREIDTAAYLDVMKGLVQDGKSVSIIVAGNSMSPFLIHRRDRVFFEKPMRPLKKGDIVFYQRENGRYIMHRICKVAKEGYYIVGDAQIEIEGPVREEQIFALITKCERKGKMVTSGSFWWEFFEKVWIRMIPLRPLIRGCYEKVTSVFRK